MRMDPNTTACMYTHTHTHTHTVVLSVTYVQVLCGAELVVKNKGLQEGIVAVELIDGNLWVEKLRRSNVVHISRIRA